MTKNHRRTVGVVGMSAAGLLASPLIALLASPVASADPVTTYGPYTYDGYTDTLSVNTSTDGFDNLLSYDGYDLDVYSPATADYDFVLTDPGLFQLDVYDTAGVFTYGDSFTAPFDVDPGLIDIGGL